MGDSKVFRADMARSVRLQRAFRTEQTEPEAFSTLLAGHCRFLERRFGLGGRAYTLMTSAVCS